AARVGAVERAGRFDNGRRGVGCRLARTFGFCGGGHGRIGNIIITAQEPAAQCPRAPRLRAWRTTLLEHVRSTLMAENVAPHVVIIGGGFGGLDAARTLAGAPVRVTLIDRHNYHLFQPLLYQVATAALSPGDIASPIRWILRRQRNVQVLLAEAQAIDAAHRQVMIDSDAISYDYLIVATGAA